MADGSFRNPAESMLSGLLDRIKGTATVEVVYGESRIVGDTTIIPIAVVATAFGAGGGGGESPVRDGERVATGGGGGGGGRIRVQPVALLRVTGAETQLLLVLDWTRIITTAVTFLGLWLVVHAWRGHGR